MLTDLVLYLNSTNDGAGRQLTTAAPAAEASTTSKTGQATGFGELAAQGSAAAWTAAAGGAPAPSGKGFLFDVTALEGQRIDVGLWRPVLKLATTSGNVTADVYLRVWKLSGGAYQAIASAVAPGTVIAAGAPMAVQVPAGVGSLTDFLTGDKLYVDVILNITLNTSSDPDATTSLYMNGGAAEMLQTPGYDVSQSLEPDTVLDLITDALIDLNAIQQGDELSAEDLDVGLKRLNFLVDRMNADRLSLNSIASQSLPLSATKGTYTIGQAAGGGSTADFNQPRPILIQSASIVIGGIRHPLDPQTARQWGANSEPGAQAQLPKKLYCDYKWPIASLNFHPAPLCANPTSIEMFYWQPLAKFAAPTDIIDLPPAYRSYLKHNLSLALALPFMKQPSDLLVQYAVNSKADVRAFNAMQLAGMVSEATAGDIPQVPAPPVDPTRPQAGPPGAPPQQ